MALYLHPPGCNTSMPKLRIAVQKRFQFLMDVLKCDGRLDTFQGLLLKPEYASCADILWENSTYDRISHFALIMLCSRDHNLSRLLLDAEHALFDFRIQLMTLEELKQSLRVTCRQAKKRSRIEASPSNSSLESTLSELVRLGYRYLTEGVFLELNTRRSGAKYGHRGMSEVAAAVPFTLVSELVARRLVILRRGLAVVQAICFATMLKSISKCVMTRNLELAATAWKEGRQVDERLDGLLDDIMSLSARGMDPPYRINGLGSLNDRLTSSNIDSLVPLFSPCMVNLHLQLRSKHRLRHHSRIQYTLFLKGLGMSLTEAIRFWKEEYNQPPRSVGHQCCEKAHACQHEWAKDEKRYVYGLRHLYGMEGSKRNYSSHCCGALQTRSLPLGEEGGCPFKHFDAANLRHFLRKDMGILDPVLLSRILDLLHSKADLGRPVCSEACSLVLNFKLRRSDTASQPIPDLEDLAGCPYFLSQPPSHKLDRAVGLHSCSDDDSCDCSGSEISDYDFGSSKPNIVFRKPQDFTRILLHGFTL